MLEPYVRRNFDCDAPGLMGLQWDKAELFTVHPIHCSTLCDLLLLIGDPTAYSNGDHEL